MGLSLIFSATRRTSRSDMQLKSAVVAISTISKPVSSLLRRLSDAGACQHVVLDDHEHRRFSRFVQQQCRIGKIVHHVSYS